MVVAVKCIVHHFVSSLRLSNQQSNELLFCTWYYYKQQYNNNLNLSMLLYRGIEIVEILSMLSIDNYSVCTALLFPLAAIGVVEKKIFATYYNKTIINIICDLRKVNTIHQLNIAVDQTIANQNISKASRILLKANCNCLVIMLIAHIIKLYTIHYLSENKWVLGDQDHTNLYIPLANYLGVSQFKWELEDYYFHCLYPNEYRYIAQLLHERRIDRERYINDFVKSLRKSMYNAGLQIHNIYGRPKHIYSIWRKMQKKALNFHELFDLYAVRIVVKQLKDCYNILHIIHNHFNYLPDKLDDYIVDPKPNGYQSIHTVILGPSSKNIEIQIRTSQMHKNAELGIAAHWKYK